jgi:hypothetical protein
MPLPCARLSRGQLRGPLSCRKLHLSLDVRAPLARLKWKENGS